MFTLIYWSLVSKLSPNKFLLLFPTNYYYYLTKKRKKRENEQSLQNKLYKSETIVYSVHELEHDSSANEEEKKL